jgi:putative transposase
MPAQPSSSWLVDGYSPEDRASDRRPADGDRQEKAGSGAGAPLNHSDRGVQYTSLSFGKRLEDEELLPSMGRVGSAYDNALAESLIATLKTELLYRNTWPTRQAARTAIFEYIEGLYNPRRRHSALGYLSPAEFEEVRLLEEDAA